MPRRSAASRSPPAVAVRWSSCPTTWSRRPGRPQSRTADPAPDRPAHRPNCACTPAAAAARPGPARSSAARPGHRRIHQYRTVALVVAPGPLDPGEARKTTPPTRPARPPTRTHRSPRLDRTPAPRPPSPAPPNPGGDAGPVSAVGRPVPPSDIRRAGLSDLPTATAICSATAANGLFDGGVENPGGESPARVGMRAAQLLGSPGVPHRQATARGRSPSSLPFRPHSPHSGRAGRWSPPSHGRPAYPTGRRCSSTDPSVG